MSFEIALSALQAVNQQLETTSNNIANAGTYGFKSSRANFSSMYAGTAAIGVEVGSITQSIGDNRGVVTTNRSLDAAIDGRGFFVSRDAQGMTSYSRVGIFSANADGILVDSNGRAVQGYPAIKGSNALGVLGDITVPTGQIPAQASTRVNYVGNLSADWTVPTVAFNPADANSYNLVKQTAVYDSLGSVHTLSQYFIKTGVNTITVRYAFDGAVPIATTANLVFDGNGQLPAVPPSPVLAFTPTNGAVPISCVLDYTGTTRLAGLSTELTNTADGYASGSLVGIEMAENGDVLAKYSNDQQQRVATLALATFADEGALRAVSDTSWVESIGSGEPLFGTPGSGLAGMLNAGALERSNVDIAAELVGLMTSQRNYQANSKVLTTQNNMLQSLMQAV